MAKFNLKETIEGYNSKIKVEMKDKVYDDDGEYFYSFKTNNGVILLELDKECFKYADNTVARAFGILLLDKNNKKFIEESRKIIDDFLERKGKYKEIKKKESIDYIKNNLKDLNSYQLDSIVYYLQILHSDEIDNKDDLANEICETIQNIVSNQ